jgi:multimeric flavodoxin WrbA
LRKLFSGIGGSLRKVQYPGSFFLDPVWDERDDASSVFKKRAEADLILFSKPIYFFDIPSLLKPFLEWMYATANVFNLSGFFLERCFLVIMLKKSREGD